MINMYQALDIANKIQGRADAQQLSQDLCAIRGQDPWTPTFVAGAGFPRWIAALAELIMLGRIIP